MRFSKRGIFNGLVIMALACLGFAAISACDSSSDQTFVVGLFATFPTGDSVHSGSAIIQQTFNSDGAGTSDVDYSSIPDVQGKPFTYTMQEHGEFITHTTAVDGSDLTLEGFFSPNAQFLGRLDHDLTEDNRIGIAFGVRKATAAPSVSGDFVGAGLASAETDTDVVFNLTDITFNADGTGQATFRISSYSDPLGPYSFTYTVDDDGKLVITYHDVPSGPLHDEPMRNGYVNEAGDVMLLLDNDSAEGIVGVDVYVKNSSGNTNASLQGDYNFTSLSHVATETVPTWTTKGVVSFDGAGTATFSAADSSNDVDLSGEPLQVPYTVADDGSVTFEFEFDSAHGAVSADGTVFTFTSDTYQSQGQPSVLFGLKRP